MKLRTLLAVALLAAAWVPLNTAAQAPPVGTPATAKLAITDLAPGPVQLPAGQTHTATFTVSFTAEGLQCTSDSSITVDLALTNAAQAPPGVTATIDPPNATIKIPTGVYASLAPGLPVTPLNASAPGTLKVVASPGTTGGDFKASVSASYKGGQPNGCVGTLPAAQDTKPHEVVIGSGSSTGGNSTSPPSPSGNTTTGNSTAPPPEENPPKKSPGPEPLLLLAGIAAVASLRRRRAA